MVFPSFQKDFAKGTLENEPIEVPESPGQSGQTTGDRADHRLPGSVRHVTGQVSPPTKFHQNTNFYSGYTEICITSPIRRNHQNHHFFQILHCSDAT
jgi:hypothetical protein